MRWLFTCRSRTSHDLDLFHDSEQAVADAFAKDRSILEGHGYRLELVLSQPGFIRARIGKKKQGLLVDWAYDSAWRFMPPVSIEGVGYVLHPVDLAVNKVLALGGREDVRDIVDALYLNERVLPMGALIWASVAKDPGLNPRMLLELLLRKGKIRPEELRRLDLQRDLDPTDLHIEWRNALVSAGEYIESRPPDEVGCLYCRPVSGLFFAPTLDEEAVIHRAEIGGVLPRLAGDAATTFLNVPELRAEVESFFERKAFG